MKVIASSIRKGNIIEHEDGQLIFNCPWPEEDFA